MLTASPPYSWDLGDRLNRTINRLRIVGNSIRWRCRAQVHRHVPKQHSFDPPRQAVDGTTYHRISCPGCDDIVESFRVSWRDGSIAEVEWLPWDVSARPQLVKRGAGRGGEYRDKHARPTKWDLSRRRRERDKAILRHIDQAGTITAVDIQQRWGLSVSGTGHIVRKMRKKGLIRPIEAVRPGAIATYELTDLGRELVENKRRRKDDRA